MPRSPGPRAPHHPRVCDFEKSEEFQKRAKYCAGNDGSDIGMRRALRKEFQEIYGLLEIEAINILSGYHGSDYLRKYYMIEHQLTVYVLRKDDEDSGQIKGLHV